MTLAVKFDLDGTVIWQKDCTISGALTDINSIINNPNGGYIIAQGTEPGCAQLILLNESGVLTNTIYRGPNESYFLDAFATENEIVAVVVENRGNGGFADSESSYVLKYNQSGSLLATIEVSTSYGYGSASIEPIFDPSDGITLIGYLMSQDNKITKYDTNGNVIFEHSYSASFVDAFPLSDGSYLAFGSFTNTIPASGEAGAVNTSLQYGDSVVTRFAPEVTYYDVEMVAIDPRSDSTVTDETTRVAANTTVTEPQNVSEYTGYQLDGWYEKDDNGEFLSEPFDFSTPINRDVKLYTKYEKLSYEIGFYTATYNTQDAEPVYRLVETRTLGVGDTTYLPSEMSWGAFGYDVDEWYVGKFVDGQPVINENMRFDLGEFTYSTSYIENEAERFDFMVSKLTRKSYPVAYTIINNCENSTFTGTVNVYYGDTIPLEYITPTDSKCILTDLKSSESAYGNYEAFDPSTPITSSLYITGTWERQYLLLHDNQLTYADGTAFDPDEADRKIVWDQTTGVLSFNGYNENNFAPVKIKNGDTPITLVFRDHNLVNIESESPLVLGGDGDLKGSIKSDSSIVIEGGDYNDAEIIATENLVMNDGEVYKLSVHQTSSDMINMVINGGKVRNVYVGSGSSYGNGTLTVNDGEITGSINMKAEFTNNIVVNGGKINTLTMESGDPEVYATSFIMNGGEATIGGLKGTKYLEVNDGDLKIMRFNDLDDTPAVEVEGFVVFNGGKVLISGGMVPLMVTDNGMMDRIAEYEEQINNVSDEEVALYCEGDLEEINADLREVGLDEFENVDECKQNLRETEIKMLKKYYNIPENGIVEFNGGDVTFEVADADKLIGYYADIIRESFRAEMEDEIASALEELDQVDEAEVIRACENMYDDFNAMFAEVGMAGFTSKDDCKQNLIERYKEFLPKHYEKELEDTIDDYVTERRAYIAGEIEEGAMPVPIIVRGDSSDVSENAIYIADDMKKDPESIEAVITAMKLVRNGQIERSTKVATFGDGNGDVSLVVEVDDHYDVVGYTVENVPEVARIYKYIPPVPDTDDEEDENEDGGEESPSDSKEKSGDQGFEWVGVSKAAASSVVISVITMIITGTALVVYRRLRQNK